MADNDDQINNSLDDILNPDTHEHHTEAELQNFQHNQDEDSVSSDSSQNHQQPQSDDLNDGNDSDDGGIWGRGYRGLFDSDDDGDDSEYNDYDCDGLCCLKNRKKDLPVFDGNLPYYDFHLWIYDVELYLEFYEIPEDRKVEFVASRLQEGALTWWKQYQNPKQQPIQEWKLMKSMLIAQFLTVDHDRVFDLPILKKNTNPDEFREWLVDVEKAFKLHKIDEYEQAELVAYRLEEGVFSWWQQIQNLSCRIHNEPITKWEHMKKILIARFASVEYERVDDLPRFRTNFSFDEFSVWVEGVERFFELYEIPKDLQVGLAASRFEEGTALTWWREMQYLSMRADKLPIQEWRLMKTMLMTRFLSPK